MARFPLRLRKTTVGALLIIASLVLATLPSFAHAETAPISLSQSSSSIQMPRTVVEMQSVNPDNRPVIPAPVAPQPEPRDPCVELVTPVAPPMPASPPMTPVSPQPHATKTPVVVALPESVLPKELTEPATSVDESTTEQTDQGSPVVKPDENTGAIEPLPHLPQHPTPKKLAKKLEVMPVAPVETMPGVPPPPPSPKPSDPKPIDCPPPTTPVPSPTVTVTVTTTPTTLPGDPAPDSGSQPSNDSPIIHQPQGIPPVSSASESETTQSHSETAGQVTEQATDHNAGAETEVASEQASMPALPQLLPRTGKGTSHALHLLMVAVGLLLVVLGIGIDRQRLGHRKSTARSSQ